MSEITNQTNIEGIFNKGNLSIPNQSYNLPIDLREWYAGSRSTRSPTPYIVTSQIFIHGHEIIEQLYLLVY